ncbi:hypothetical protein GGX14DRAFT_674218 [Mycena pura]|uniref:Zn(2)-C6 fungal-type domain-containing protein n=1 Tax=Mycena pura TaxID=153505 RepID=A0AAD6Y2G6_9AGAR|nr:hypothetical protein GGX14DRAFT_674218 [Mycena pura]
MDEKLKTATCERCKRRKIRCNGQSPCMWCAKTNAACTYDNDRESGFGNELKKGAACLACRRKKKKCDGKQPCQTCLAGRSPARCEYDGLHNGNAPDIDSPNGSRSSSELSVTVAASSSALSSDCAIHSQTPGVSRCPTQVTDTRDPSPLVEPRDYLVFSELSQARDMFLDDAEKRGLSPAATAASERSENASSVADVSVDFSSQHDSPFFQRFCVFIIAFSSIDRRKLFLAHRIQFGLSVPDAKLLAISQGAADEAELHPVLLHACQLVGYMLARHRPHGTGEWARLPGQDAHEAAQTRASLAALQPSHSGSARAPCPLVYLQTATLLSAYFFNKGDLALARTMLARADHVVHDHRLDDLASPHDVAGTRATFRLSPTTRTVEALAALSQLIYIDLTYAIMLGLPILVHARLHETFRKLIRVPNPNAEINFVRAKSAFLLYEAQQLAQQWARPELAADPVATTAWQARYWDLMEALDAHRGFLTLVRTRAAFCPRLHTLALSIKVACVLALTGLAVLLTLFAGNSADLAQKKHEVVLEIIGVSGTFSAPDCAYLDPILSACWISVVRSLDACIELGPATVQSSMHDAPAMLRMIRARNETLQRALPFALEV